MTLITLAVLAAAWLGYFALCYRDKRASRPRRGDGLVGLTPAFDPKERRTASIRSIPASPRTLGDLLESPRTRQQAHRRRRQVATLLIAAAVGSLVAVPVAGAAALVVHVLADVVLIVFAFGYLHRQQGPSLDLADVRVLYPARPAPSDAAMPLRRVANG